MRICALILKTAIIDVSFLRACSAAVFSVCLSYGCSTLPLHAFGSPQTIASAFGIECQFPLSDQLQKYHLQSGALWLAAYAPLNSTVCSLAILCLFHGSLSACSTGNSYWCHIPHRWLSMSYGFLHDLWLWWSFLHNWTDSSYPSQLLEFLIIHQGVLSFCVCFFGIISTKSCIQLREADKHILFFHCLS